MDYFGSFPYPTSGHLPEDLVNPVLTKKDRGLFGADLKFERTTPLSPNYNSGNAKRHNNDNLSQPVCCKRTRITCDQPYTSVNTNEEFATRKERSFPDSTKNSSGSTYSFPWCTFSRNGDNILLEAPLRQSFFPGYFEDQEMEPDQYEDTYSPNICFSPRKLIPIGQNHQADIPAWKPDCYRRRNEDDADNLTKFRIMPMYDTNSAASESSIGHGRQDCFCLDQGSTRCIRQHVTEAREKLRILLGHKQFKELGFCEMGEDISLRWSKEEEELFQEVVMLNPASLGKNFWDVLPCAFPSRTCKELVSYYFNVFILRRRAEQNRSDPSYADSDDDEWQEPNDPEQNDDDEDSAVESPDSEDQDVNDDSCTSFEDQHNVGYMDSKPWDIGYVREMKEIELLPTTNVIEEVFSHESHKD